MCCTLVVRYRSSSATNLGRTNHKIRGIVLVLLPCSILSQNTGKRRKQSSCTWERLAGDAPAGKAARAPKFGGWMAATAGATDPFQLGMVSIQNRISVTGKEIVTLDETSSSFILSAMARSNLAEVGSKD